MDFVRMPTGIWVIWIVDLNAAGNQTHRNRSQPYLVGFQSGYLAEIRPGTDKALALGMANIIIQEVYTIKNSVIYGPMALMNTLNVLCAEYP
jgi:hypothetical protein